MGLFNEVVHTEEVPGSTTGLVIERQYTVGKLGFGNCKIFPMIKTITLNLPCSTRLCMSLT
jgi:hypothetical protein